MIAEHVASEDHAGGPSLAATARREVFTERQRGGEQAGERDCRRGGLSVRGQRRQVGVDYKGRVRHAGGANGGGCCWMLPEDGLLNWRWRWGPGPGRLRV